MRWFPYLMLCSYILCGLLLCRNVWAISCHRERQFIRLKGSCSVNPQERIGRGYAGITEENCKADGNCFDSSVLGVAWCFAHGPFVSTDVIKVMTSSASFFCSVECLKVPYCKSYAFLKTAETDNCHLGSTEEGLATQTEADVYKLDASSITGCTPSPCLNGGSCHDTCEQPYHLCYCPSDKQGDNCEWDIARFNTNWHQSFDHAGEHLCTGSTFMAGFKRSTGEKLLNLEEAVCGPLSIEYSQSTLECAKADWWNTFGKEAWSYCPSGMLLRGFWRQDGSQDLGYIEEGRCCKPVGSTYFADCYYEDITLSFDEPWAQVSCQKPLYFIYGIRTSEGEELRNMEELHCCKFGG